VPLYNNFKEQLFRSAIADLNAAGTAVKVSLHSGYTPNIDTHQVWADVSATEMSGTGYTAGGVTLANKVVAQDNTNDRATFDADNASWTGLNIGTPSHAIVRDSTNDVLIGYWAVTTPSNGGDYTLAFDSNGIATLT
jgi:hypothetical protein